MAAYIKISVYKKKKITKEGIYQDVHNRHSNSRAGRAHKGPPENKYYKAIQTLWDKQNPELTSLQEVCKHFRFIFAL